MKLVITDSEGKSKDIPQLALELIKISPFNTMKLCPENGFNYIDDTKGFYVSVAKQSVERKISMILESYGFLQSQSKVTTIYNQFCLIRGFPADVLLPDRNFRSFTNGLFDLTKLQLIDNTPSIFTIGRLNFGYKDTHNLPIFDNFMAFLCG